MKFSKMTLLQMGLVILGGIAEVVLLGFEDKKAVTFEEQFDKCYEQKKIEETKSE